MLIERIFLSFGSITSHIQMFSDPILISSHIFCICGIFRFCFSLMKLFEDDILNAVYDLYIITFKKQDDILYGLSNNNPEK